MPRIAVNTVWQGLVGVRDKYIKEAQNTGEALTILHNREAMTIPSRDILSRIYATSDKPFTDRYGQDPHYLIYFRWVPDAKQAQLKL